MREHLVSRARGHGMGNRLKRVRIIVAVLATFLAFPTLSSGQVRSWSDTFNPTPPTPSFQPQTHLPLITFTATYDTDAGTLTISESGGDPSYYGGWQGRALCRRAGKVSVQRDDAE